MASSPNTPQSHLPVNLPDASEANWVDRFAPEVLKPWLKLGRFDRPIGIWLLFLPGLMGLVAVRPLGLDMHLWVRIVEFALGAALMRAAGCAYNDLIDRDIDKLVERTRNRPIASGAISPKAAMAYIVAFSLISLLILLDLGQFAIWLGVGALGLVAAYPFMKRITWWPQAWLGLTFNWGFPMAVASLTSTVPLWAWVFYAGLVAWTIGYDTIYALQDREDDALIGVKSSARALGGQVQMGVFGFYAVAIVFSGLSGILASFKPLYFIGLGLVGAHLIWQVKALKSEDGANALRLFRSNQTCGIFWVVSLAVRHWV